MRKRIRFVEQIHIPIVVSSSCPTMFQAKGGGFALAHHRPTNAVMAIGWYIPNVFQHLGELARSRLSV